MQFPSSLERDAFWTICDVVSIWSGCHFTCPKCDSANYQLLARRLTFRCKKCRTCFSPKSFGCFRSSKLSYRKLVQMLDYSLEGKNAHQIYKLTGVNYRTSVLLLKRVRAGRPIPSDRSKKG
jgi:transposase-like protein